MGKIRVSALGTSDEQAQKEKARVKREEKKKRLTHIAGMKGGEKIVDMSTTEPLPDEALAKSGEETSESSLSSKPLKSPKKLKSRGHAYLDAKKLVDKNKFYSQTEAFDLIKKTSLTKFDGSVEVAINCTEKGLRGQVPLPHGTGKQVRVAVFNDALIEQLDSGKIDFDILVAAPNMMPKLVKYAKLLGPKGLMPNPKSGTISDKPEELAKKLSSGQTQFKTEADFPIIHFVLGKVSFAEKDLEENYQALITAVGQAKIKSVFLKSSMGPSVKVKIYERE